MKGAFVSESGAKCTIALESFGFLFPETNETQASSSLKSSSSHCELLELDISAAARPSKSFSSAPTNQQTDKENILNIFELWGNKPPLILF